MPIGEPPISSPVTVGVYKANWPRPWATWFSQAWAILQANEQSGTTANRPTANLWTGRRYWDTTLGLPIYWSGSAWVKADGTAA